ncbi:MAG: metallophosphoesterase family protein [Candidatus Sumerlaeia bacterium]|nr:metallophosphoesterase family protein [Candidatus Sumerlaeia bacterium]
MTGNPPHKGPDLTKKARKIAVFSDIHGNLHALQAVLDAIAKESVDIMICCGDIVGYGARPNECVEAVRRLKVPTIAGNHDHAALQLTDISNFNDIAKAAVLWTRDVLTEDNSEFLRQMPLTITDTANNVFYVHASPKDPGQWNYILTMGEARTNFNYFTQQVCFIGHSHQPFIIENDNGNLVCPPRLETDIVDGKRYLVNVGSVGQPRDHNWRACYVIWDVERRRLEVRRAEYDLPGSQQAILQAGLPRELADRLAHGM